MSLKVEKHKGYIGTYEPDTDSNGFYGKIAFITDLVTFSGETRKELQASFNEAVDDYLAFCEDIGKEPKKSFNGVFQVRTTPVLHERASIYAIENDMTLNQFITKSIEVCTSPSNETVLHRHVHVTSTQPQEIFTTQVKEKGTIDTHYIWHH